MCRVRRNTHGDVGEERYGGYYKTPRGFHPRSGNSTDGWNVTSSSSFLNARILAYAGEIEAFFRKNLGIKQQEVF